MKQKVLFAGILFSFLFLMTQSSNAQSNSHSCPTCTYFTYLNAAWQGNSVIFSWTIKNEPSPTSTMLVQRSTDGVNFATVATVSGTPGSTSPTTYTGTDVNPPTNMRLFYRILVLEWSYPNTSRVLALSRKS